MEMAGSFVVEDGTGLPDANSYVSVSDALSYLDVYPVSTSNAFSSLELDEQERVLKTATHLIDTRLFAYFKGDGRAVDGQSLLWPRTAERAVGWDSWEPICELVEGEGTWEMPHELLRGTAFLGEVIATGVAVTITQPSEANRALTQSSTEDMSDTWSVDVRSRNELHLPQVVLDELAPIIVLPGYASA
jgi:hypothetical protein